MKPFLEKPIDNGIQKLYRFKNNYGASVIRHKFSYGGKEGLWELAVIHFINRRNDSWNLCYSTRITSDIEGHLEWPDVEKLLRRISRLKKK